MPKLVINDKSGKKNTSMNFFLDDEVIFCFWKSFSFESKRVNKKILIYIR